jgi:hypothetical protein
LNEAAEILPLVRSIVSGYDESLVAVTKRAHHAEFKEFLQRISVKHGLRVPLAPDGAAPRAKYS